jgi:LuxR family transcriptional regulator, maltose regulon positive regulatory protein
VTDAATGIPVVPSKLEPPMVPSDEVRRPRLDAALDSEHQIVIVTAPAGYGKTTSVAGWVRRSPRRRTAWVSLDPLDRNALSFWRHVTESIARVVPAAREADAILVERGHPGPEFIAALAHALWEDGGPLVLVLDDLQHAEAATMRDELTTLVDRCRDLLRLVTISRSDPPLPTQRWLAEGRAIELRMDALAFRPDEAAALMRRFDVAGLADPDVERLNLHVEGWAVGLLLSGLTLEGRPDLATTLDDLLHSDRHLTDYLMDEVLDRLPEDLRDLALTLSVPTSFDEDLAQRLTGRADAGALLERLLRSNPFVVAIASPPAYRFHHQVRALLSNTFRWTDAAGFERAHRETAAVMVERGHIADAIASLREIGAVDEAFDLVTEPVLQTTDQGRVRELVQWLEMLQDVQPSDPMRALDYALALVIAGRTEHAIAVTDRAAALGDGDDARFAVALAAMRVTTLGAAGLVDEAVCELPAFDAVEGDVHDSRHIDSRISSQMSRLALEVGDLERAEQWLPHLAEHPEPAVSEVLAPAMRSWRHLELGAVTAALAEAVAACAAAERLELRPHLAALDALLSRGRAEALAMRTHDLAATLHALDEDSDAIDLPFFLLRLWPLRLDAQALEAGWPAALELSRTFDPEAYPRRGGRLATRHDELRALALLNCGLTDDAAAIVGHLPAGIRRSLLTARGLLIGGRREDVGAVLVGHEDWRVPQRLEALLLLAQSQPGAEALATMSRALVLGRDSGALAPFVLEGRRVQRLLDALPVDELFPALSARHGVAPAHSSERRSIDIVEPLTAKELTVLALLPSHATYRAIGAQLYVSVNTVKTHVASIYRKLGVSSRAEAVEVARRWGLLDA